MDFVRTAPLLAMVKQLELLFKNGNMSKTFQLFKSEEDDSPAEPDLALGQHKNTCPAYHFEKMTRLYTALANAAQNAEVEHMKLWSNRFCLCDAPYVPCTQMFTIIIYFFMPVAGALNYNERLCRQRRPWKMLCVRCFYSRTLKYLLSLYLLNKKLVHLKQFHVSRSII